MQCDLRKCTRKLRFDKCARVVSGGGARVLLGADVAQPPLHTPTPPPTHTHTHRIQLLLRPGWHVSQRLLRLLRPLHHILDCGLWCVCVYVFHLLRPLSSRTQLQPAYTAPCRHHLVCMQGLGLDQPCSMLLQTLHWQLMSRLQTGCTEDQTSIPLTQHAPHIVSPPGHHCHHDNSPSIGEKDKHVP